MDIIEIIKARRARKAFSSKKVEQDKVDSLLEAFRWSPSSRNNQPWKVIIVDNRNILDRLFHAFTLGNQLWVKNVPLFFLVISKPDLAEDAKAKDQRVRVRKELKEFVCYNKYR